MSTAENAKLQYEAGQTAVAMAALTDSGDHINFTSAATLWSGRGGYAPVVRANGLLTGGAVSTHATNNTVTVAAMTLNLNGVVTAISAGSVAATRPAGAVSKVNSITINAAGSIANVAGTDGGTTAFSETRGAAGGPPLIPVDSVEIAQVRYTSTAAAVVAAAEIFQTVGTHRERADYPLYTTNHGPTVVDGAQTVAGGSVTMLDTLPLIHTGPTAKKVFASYSQPIFSDVTLASDFVPPETSHSVTSTQVYGSTIGSSTASLGQGSFTAYLNDGINDPLVVIRNATLWFKFFPDRYQSAYLLCQGKLGISRTFPAGAQLQADCTISASQAAIEVA